jgi:hypothetical protein
MTRNTIVASATSSPSTPGLLTGALSISTFGGDGQPPIPTEYELQLTVQQLGPGILRAAIVDLLGSEELMPICMINVVGPIGGPPGTDDNPAPQTQYSQSWTQSDAPGVRFGAPAATLGVYVYESDSPATISATAIY